MADETNMRQEATRLIRESAKLLEDSECGEEKAKKTSTTAELQKLFAPYSSVRQNPCQTVQKAKRQRRWTPMFSPSTTWTQVIPPGQNGYSIPYLRDESTLRQAVAYIRPLQKSIDLPDVKDEVSTLYINLLHPFTPAPGICVIVNLR